MPITTVLQAVVSTALLEIIRPYQTTTDMNYA